MRSRLLLLAAASAVAIPLSSIALAAEPESGTISPAAPSVKWSGELTAPYFVWLQWFRNNGEGECTSPACDSFALEVAGGPANVTLKMEASSPDSGSFESIRVVKPDGSIAYFNNTETADAETKLLLKNAVNGKYSVDISTGAKGPATYEASAEMAGGAAPTGGGGATQPPPPSTTPAPSTGGPQDPGGQQGTQPAPAEDFELTVKAPKIKARKARKGAKVKATVTVSREVESLTATLKKRKKKVGAGKLGRFSGTRKVTIKLSKKLKAGGYALTVAARNSRGVVVTRTVAVKVKK